MEYAAILIKPDAVRDVLDALILDEIQQSVRCSFVFRKMWVIKSDTVGELYPTWTSRTVYPFMVQVLTAGPSLLCVVAGADDLFDSLRAVKGKMDRGGLRLKYRTYSIEEWSSRGTTGDRLRLRMSENRIHTVDSFDETVHVCSLALSPSERASLTRHTRLADALAKKMALVPYPYVATLPTNVEKQR